MGNYLERFGVRLACGFLAAAFFAVLAGRPGFLGSSASRTIPKPRIKRRCNECELPCLSRSRFARDPMTGGTDTVVLVGLDMQGTVLRNYAAWQRLVLSVLVRSDHQAEQDQPERAPCEDSRIVLEHHGTGCHMVGSKGAAIGAPMSLSSVPAAVTRSI